MVENDVENSIYTRVEDIINYRSGLVKLETYTKIAEKNSHRS